MIKAGSIVAERFPRDAEAIGAHAAVAIPPVPIAAHALNRLAELLPQTRKAAQTARAAITVG